MSMRAGVQGSWLTTGHCEHSGRDGGHAEGVEKAVTGTTVDELGGWLLGEEAGCCPQNF